MYKKVLGLEIHAQIATNTKLVSCALNEDLAENNTNVQWIDAGVPGSLPVINEAAIHMALQTALALGMQINNVSIFDRKQYFYQDLPLGYQITQFYKPIGINGFLECSFGKVRINRLHIEADAGKSVYEGDTILVDLNRAGVPLMEIVTEPDFKNADEVVEFLKELRALLLCLGTCKCDMSQGNLRADVNLSLHKGNEPYGTRVEMKNLNSYRFIAKAIEYEAIVQEKQLNEGKRIVQETKLFDSKLGVTKSMRDKEEAADYRYFPDPDLLPIFLEQKFIDQTRNRLPKLPQQIREEYLKMGVALQQAYILTEHPMRIEFFNNLIAQLKNDKYIAIASNWVGSELLGRLKKIDFEDFINDIYVNFIANFAKIIVYTEEGKISRSNAKSLLDEIMAKRCDIDKLIAERGYMDKLSNDALLEIIKHTLEANKNEVARYKDGKTQLLMFFVGCVIKETKGKCDPEFVKMKCLELLSS